MLDLRTPIGVLFIIIGALLATFGAAHNAGVYIETGLNIDLIWGVVLLVFGVAMLALAARAGRAAAHCRPERTSASS